MDKYVVVRLKRQKSETLADFLLRIVQRWKSLEVEFGKEKIEDVLNNDHIAVFVIKRKQ